MYVLNCNKSLNKLNMSDFAFGVVIDRLESHKIGPLDARLMLRMRPTAIVILGSYDGLSCVNDD